MNKIKKILLIFTLVISTVSSASTNSCKSPVHVNNNITSLNSTVCDVLIKSEACKEVPSKDLLICKNDSVENKTNLWTLVQSCAVGVFESVEDLLKFIWDIMTWVGESASSGEKISEYSQMTKLYLHTEYQKAYAKTSPPMQNLKAAAQMGEAVSSLLLKSIQNIISENYQEFGCLNANARSRVTCKLIGSIFVPPAGAITLIKQGPKALNEVRKLKEAIAKMGPAKTAPYKTKDMNSYYEPEQTGAIFGTKVVYFTDAERENLKISIKNGKILNKKNIPMNVKKAIYVMGADGQIYIHPKPVNGFIHHSSILAGKPVAAAGEISIKDGVITLIDRVSGHYKPTPKYLNQIFNELKNQGADLTRVKKEYKLTTEKK